MAAVGSTQRPARRTRYPRRDPVVATGMEMILTPSTAFVHHATIIEMNARTVADARAVLDRRTKGGKLHPPPRTDTRSRTGSCGSPGFPCDRTHAAPPPTAIPQGDIVLAGRTGDPRQSESKGLAVPGRARNRAPVDGTGNLVFIVLPWLTHPVRCGVGNEPVVIVSMRSSSGT